MNVKNTLLLSLIVLTFAPTLVCAQPSIKLPLLVKQESLAPLFFASIREKDNKGIIALIKIGIDVSTMCEHGKSGMDVAAEIGNKEALEILNMALFVNSISSRIEEKKLGDKNILVFSLIGTP